MINKLLKKYAFYLFFVLFFLIITNQQNAKEILIYADQITYDQKNNIIANGKAKILYKNNIISSNLIIYSQTTGDITLPIEFTLKDERNNYYYGTSGSFNSTIESGTINNAKVLLVDGSRIVGKKIKRDGKIEMLESIERISEQTRIIDILKDHNYQNIELKQANGKIVCLNRTVKTKLT